MKDFLVRALDILFPPRAEELIVRSLTDRAVAALVDLHSEAGTTSLFRYREGSIRALVRQLKYKGDGRAAHLLGNALAQYLREQVPGQYIVLPIPLAPRRFRERGFNQVTLVAKYALKDMPRFMFREDILVRTDTLVSQTTLTRPERIHNVRDTISVTDCAVLEGKDVMLLDDVTTTGATLGEAERAVFACKPKSVRKMAIAR